MPLVLVVAVIALGAIWAGVQTADPSSPPLASPAHPSTQDLPGPADRSAIQIRPGRVPRVLTGEVDSGGEPVTVACATCHATRPPDAHTNSSDALDEFHLGLTFRHGNSACLACHNADDYDALRLANGTRVEFVDVMRLCAQCHGPQYRDYLSGAHGGMNGFWDMSRGPRTRNNCIDCHDPHAPQLPHMIPQFKSRDRFLEPEHPHGVSSDE